MYTSKDYLKVVSALGSMTIQEDTNLYPEPTNSDKQDMEVVKIGDER